MAINNPYIPGDPYSYDLKWLVAKVKEILAQLGTLDEAIEAKIFEGFLEHSIVQFKTVPEMLSADITDGSIVLTLGYHEAGDLGGLFYLVKDFNPSQCALDYFLTLDNNKQIAIPVVVTPYVTPEMFGAKGDGATDDTISMQKCFAFPNIYMRNTYLITDSVDIQSRQSVICDGTIKVDVPYAGLSATKKVFNDNNLEGFTWSGGKIKGTGVDDTTYLSLFYIEDGKDITIEDLKIENVPFVFCMAFWSCSDIRVKNCTIDHYSYGGICFYDGTENAIADGNVISNLDVPGTGTGYPLSLSGGVTGNFTVSKNIKAVNNTIDNSGTIARWEGIDAHGGKDLVIANNIIKGCITGVMVGTTTSYAAKNVAVMNNLIDGVSSGANGYGLSLHGTNISASGNIVRNIKQTLGSAGAYIDTSSNLMLSGNTFEDCSTGVVFNASDGVVIVKNNIFDRCGRYTQSGYAVFREMDRQEHTEITDNILLQPNGILRANPYPYNDGYFKFMNNKCFDVIDADSAGVNAMICDLRTQAPSQASTKMGIVGDICKLAQPVAGSPYSWICTVAWNPTTQTSTWVVLDTL